MTASLRSLYICYLSLEDLVAECDVVFHLAAEPGVRPSWGQRFEAYTRNNVLATQHLLEATREHPDVRFVYASSSSVYGQAESFPTEESVVPAPFSPYGMTKLSGEHLCGIYAGNFGVSTVSLRYFSVYGPRQRPDMAFRIFCTRALRDEPIEVYGDGLQTRDFTFVGDIVAATRAAALADVPPGAIFNVGGGSAVSLRETIDMLGEIRGAPLNARYGEPQKGDVRDTAANISAARKHLGYAPQVDLETGLRAQWEWAVEQTARQGARADSVPPPSGARGSTR